MKGSRSKRFFPKVIFTRNITSRPGFEPGLKALCASSPQASGMSTTPSGQQKRDGMLLVIKPIAPARPWLEPLE
jgi:hypothetical protein